MNGGEKLLRTEDWEERRKLESRPQIIMACVLLFSLGLIARLPHWGASGLWLDECITAYRVANLHSVFTTNDASPWFYPLVVWISTCLFGSGESGLRLPSLIAGAALGPSIFLILRERWPKHTAIFGALLGVFNPLSLHYAQEARVYALGMLLAVVWFGLLRNLLYPLSDDPPSKFLTVALVTLSPMLALCHHYSLYVGAAGALVATARLSSAPDLRKRVLKPLLIAYAVTLALWLPTMLVYTLGYAKKQVESQTNPFAPHATSDTVLGSILGTPLNPLYDLGLSSFSSLVLGASVLFLALGLSWSRSAWSWGGGYLTCILLTMLGHAYVPNYVGGRYDTAFLGIALVNLALALSYVPKPALRYFAMGLVLVSQLYGCWKFWSIPVPKSGSNAMAEFIEQEKVDLVLLTLPHDFDPLYLMPMAYYLHEVGGSDVPILEMPRFQAVPDSFVSPGVHYLLYSELLKIPQSEAQRKLREALDQHRKVAVVGQDTQLDALVPVLKDYNIEKSSRFPSYLDGSPLVLIVSGRREIVTKTKPEQ